MSRALVISSDGHASARFPDYREYLEARYLAAFDEELAQYARIRDAAGVDGGPTRVFMLAEPAANHFFDTPLVEDYLERFVRTGRTDGESDAPRRIAELEREGVVAEVLFPQMVPFVGFLGVRLQHGPRHIPQDLSQTPTQELFDAGARAYNRWLADFCASRPGRFAGMAMLPWHDVDASIREVRWARDAGLRGVVITVSALEPGLEPMYDSSYDPLWEECAALGMVVNSHGGAGFPDYPGSDEVSKITRMATFFADASAFSHRSLSVMILGGVLERHPRLQLVFTEMGSAWVVGHLRQMDYEWEHGDAGHLLRDTIPRRPSEYFRRQCHLGASLLSRAEVQLRSEIGDGLMMFGVDYPHFESTWRTDTLQTLQACFGGTGISEGDARRILGETALEVFGFDADELAPIAARVGPPVEQILTAPTAIDARLERGDVLRPAASRF